MKRLARSRPMYLALSIAIAMTLLPDGAQGAPPTPAFGPSIDPYAVYEGQSTCSTDPKPGVVDFSRMALAAYPYTGSYGISRECNLGGQSEHKEGRAFDWMVSASNSRDVGAVDDMINWLLATDRYGNRHANARRLGVMYIIWNNWMWRAYDVTRTTNASSDPHDDHIHISFGWDGAYARTSYFTGGYGCSPDTAGCPLTRLGGSDRYATSVVVARAAVPESDTVVIASGEPAHLVDGLVAAPLATAHSAPVLLTQGSTLPASVGAEITRRGATRALVVGGEGAVAASVVDQLAGLGVSDVQRFAGVDRYATAAAVAGAVGSPAGRAFVATGLNSSLVYALLAGAPGAALQAPVLLVPPTQVPPVVSAALADLGVASVQVVSPPALVPDAVLAGLPGATRIAGTDAYSVSTALATAVAPVVGVADVVLGSGDAAHVVDSLPGGVFGRAVLLTPTASLSTVTRSWLAAHPEVASVTVLGGTGAVTDFTARMASLYVTP